MLTSALNFASGFFGIPYEDKYLQSITIEDPGVRSLTICVSNIITISATSLTTHCLLTRRMYTIIISLSQRLSLLIQLRQHQ